VTRRALVWIGLICLLIGLAPVISVLISSGIAKANGCILNEGGINPCFIGQHDIGGLLASMFVMGWFMLITLPVALAGGIILLLLKGADLIKWLLAKR